MLIRLVPSLLASAAIGLAIAGCGSSASSTANVTGVDLLARAASTTTDAGGARMSLAITVGGAELPSQLTINGGGFFNYKAGEGSITMTLSGLPGGSVPGLSGPVDIQELFKSSTVYVGSPLFAGKLPGGARWMKLDLGRFGQALGLNIQQLAGGQSNPAQFLDYLKASSGGVTPVGHDVIRGVVTTHYRGAIDLNKVADVVKGANSAQLHAAIAQLTKQLGVSSLPVDAWVDGHGLVRRISLSQAFPVNGQRLNLGLIMELFQFGPTPTVTAPPASEVFDGTQAALGGLGGLSAGG